jgi:hypothetical protein
MYKVQFLDDKDFESLDYPDMHSSLGVADPSTNTAYVRKTGIKVLDAMNLIHELDHLKDGDQGEFAHHKANGVYYKKINDFLEPAANLFSFIPGPWQAPAGIYSATRLGMNAFGQGGNQAQQESQPQQFVQQEMPQPQPNAITPPGGGGTQGGGANVGTGVLNKALQAIRSKQQEGSGAFDLFNRQFGAEQGRSF